MSLDGYIADPSDGVGPLFDWFGIGDVEITCWWATGRREEQWRSPARIGPVELVDGVLRLGRGIGTAQDGRNHAHTSSSSRTPRRRTGPCRSAPPFEPEPELLRLAVAVSPGDGSFRAFGYPKP